MKRIIQILLIVAFIAWMVEWFGGFGFSFGSRLFQHPNSRLLSLFLSMVAIAVPPLSGYWVVTRTLDQKVSAIRAFVVNLVISGLPVFLFWAVHAIWIAVARNAGWLAFQADTAMGIGIDFLFCLFVFLIANLAIVFFLVAYTLVRRNKTKNQRGNKDENYSAQK